MKAPRAAARTLKSLICHGGGKSNAEHAFDYSIRSELPAYPEEPASLGARFLKTLDALSDIDPIFADWQVMKYGPGDSFPLATVRPRIAAIIENNVQRDDSRQPQPDEGYTLGAYTETTDARRTMHLRQRWRREAERRY